MQQVIWWAQRRAANAMLRITKGKLFHLGLRTSVRDGKLVLEDQWGREY